MGCVFQEEEMLSGGSDEKCESELRPHGRADRLPGAPRPTSAYQDLPGPTERLPEPGAIPRHGGWLILFSVG